MNVVFWLNVFICRALWDFYKISGHIEGCEILTEEVNECRLLIKCIRGALWDYYIISGHIEGCEILTEEVNECRLLIKCIYLPGSLGLLQNIRTYRGM